MSKLAGKDKRGPKKVSDKLYMGVDVGGTKILAALAEASGRIVARKRRPTPRGGRPRPDASSRGTRERRSQTLAAITAAMEDVLAKAGRGLAGIGVAIPGVADSRAGRIVITPNMDLSGVPIVAPLARKFGVPVALGNDVNLGALAERWLGSSAGASSAVGVFIGTGIGGGIIQDGRLLTGYRGAAGEVGHMRMQLDGPLCGCGGRGCLEALASRTAIERDIRQAVAAGAKTILTELTASDLRVIKSGMLKEALEHKDKLVMQVMGRAAEILGEACLNLRHLLDPEVIVLGGGVIEACESFLMPIVERVVAADPLGEAGAGCRVAVSALGDDAVVLGAIALAVQAAGGEPTADQACPSGGYPTIGRIAGGRAIVAGKTYTHDLHIRADGKVKDRAKLLRKLGARARARIDQPELERLCKDRPRVLIVATSRNGSLALTRKAQDFLRRRSIALEVLPGSTAAKAYNAARSRKAAIIRLGP